MAKSKVKSQKSTTEAYKIKLSTEEVRHLGRLARIALTDQEVAQFQKQLAEVIDYNMSLLSEVDVSEVPPTSQTTGLVNVWQEDESRPSQSQNVALSNAPAKQGGFFVVKKVLGET